MTKNLVNNKVILNSIQDLQRLPLLLINYIRGRYQYGMTPLCNERAFTLNRHAESSLLSISTAQKAQGRDPEQKHLRMALCKGFTLVELLVVVLIIGILVAVAVPQYQQAVAYSSYNRLKPFVHALAEAEERYYVEHGTYTLEVEELDLQFSYVRKDPWRTGEVAYYTSFGQFNVIDQRVDGAPRVAGTWDKEISVTYSIWLREGSSGKYAYPGKRVCRGYNSISKKICQKETGKKNPTFGDNGWVYP